MVDSSERKIMAELNGFPNYRDSAGSKPSWTKPATNIPIPTNPRLSNMTFNNSSGTQRNAPRNSEHPPTHQSGTNPFNAHSLRNKKGIGNPTSAKTLLNSIPDKKARHEHTFTPAPDNRKSVPTNKNTTQSEEIPERNRNITSKQHIGNSRRSSVVPEQVIIDDDDDHSVPEPVAGVKRSFQDRQSSDELNIKSHKHGSPPHQSSKYQFSKADVIELTEEERNSRLVPDGKYTRWIEEKYGTKDDSDPISEFDDFRIRKEQPPETNVQKLIDHFDHGPKVDLTNKIKIAKNMKPKDQSKGQLRINRVRNVNPEPLKGDDKIQDSIATSTTLQKQWIPLKRVCVEHSEYSGEYLGAFFSPDVPLLIRDGNEDLFSLSSWPKETLEMQYTTGDDPTIQIKSYVGDSSTRILTIHFLTKNDTKGRYEKFFARLQGAVVNRGVVRGDKQLWQIAEQQRDQTAAEHSRSSKGKGKEPQLKKQKLSPPEAQSKSLRYTPSDRHHSRTSDLKDEGSEGQGSRSTSKSRLNPLPPPQTRGIVAPRRSTRNAPPEKPIDQDKVILVYPQGIPGAVNITNGDLARLQPGEYLNDTLIEFGLKLWLKQLEERQPELAQQIHIFNSFFYKKLNNKKNEMQAFETVRKWTSKFNIFQKKYIIVPINEHMHWYLAVIYEPEHVLSSIAPDETPTRKRTRLYVKEAKIDPLETISTSAPEPADAVASARSITSSELEVERNLDTDFQGSCNIDAEKMETKSDDDALSYMTDPNDIPRPPADETSVDNPKEITMDIMDVDDPVEIQSVGMDNNTPTEVPKASPSKSVLEVSLLMRSVPPSSFYGSANSAKIKGKQKAKAEIDPMDIDVDEHQNKTHIFTFDSLGTNHPHATKKLAQYLRMEAKDKKGIPNAGFATGKTAFVPVQPNFCDCGVYLLHFAQTFLTDPKKYFKLIMSQSKSTSNQERQEQWNDKQVADMRGELSSQIQDLSTVWIKERVLKEEEARAQQGSKNPNQIDIVNSDSEIEMPTPVRKSGRAARLRGG